MKLRAREDGQAVVEFALAISLFLVMILGILDFGKAVYQYNGVSEAAREIARATSVHRGVACPPACTSPETLAVIATQKQLIPDLGNPTFVCISPEGSTKSNGGCAPGDSIRVSIYAPYRSLTPLLRLVSGTRPPCVGSAVACLQGTSTVKIQ